MMRSGKQGWLQIFRAILIVTQFLALSATAADKLDVDLIPAALRVRNEAPIPAQVKFRWNGTYILEGHLEVELHEANRVLGRYRSGDLALTTGEQTFHIVLPPCIEPYSDSQVEAHMKFVTAKQELDLGYSILFVPTMSERSFVLGWCNAHFGSDLPLTTQQDLMFEKLAPPDANAARKLLTTSIVRINPEELPAQPLTYTSFDVMVLSGDAFKAAHEGQLRALARWVKGGGSVCVFVNGGLKAHHVEFLNELAEASVIDPAFATDADGNLMPGREKISLLHSGLGRSVIVAGSTAADAGAGVSAWRQATAFLWKFRAVQMQAIAATGHWEPVADPEATQALEAQIQRYQHGGPQQPPPRRWVPPNVNYTGSPSYSIQTSQLYSELMGQLIPRTVRLIPFPALVATLGIFLLVIGPVDYFVLGALKRRKYTWVLFPAMSIAFMVATVMMANYFLGQRDQRRSLVVVDMSKDGTPLRWNRYELIFAARDRQVVTELKDALWTPLNPGMMSAVGYAVVSPGVPYSANGYRYNRRGSSASRDFGPPWYEGSLPVHFRTTQSVNQWEPKLNRIFSFEPPPVPLLPNWQAIEEAWPNLENIQAKLSASKIRADLCSLSPATPTYSKAGAEFILSPQILEELCHGDSTGLLAIVSQVSPTGGGNFEDAQAMDTGDSALVIVTQNGDDIVVYRRFFHGK